MVKVAGYGKVRMVEDRERLAQMERGAGSQFGHLRKHSFQEKLTEKQTIEEDKGKEKM